MIKKEKFIEILRKLEEAEDIKRDVNDIFKKSSFWELSDFADSAALMVCMSDEVVELLADMFNDEDEMISYWVYDLNFGKSYFDGCIVGADGTNIDIETPEKLYDYLINEINV